MSEKHSVCTNLVVSKEDSSANNCGTQPTNATLPVNSSSNSTKIESADSIELTPLQNEDSASLQNSSVPTAKETSAPKITKHSQLPEIKNSRDIPETPRNNAGLQYLAVFLKFLEQQLTSQVPLFFIGTLGFIVVVMLISQASEGIKVKLDLEVSPKSSQVEKNR
ncbi:hypothetical protein I8748_02900 [Nostoc sp. CENA67]|uniref:Uncharacterized protein n=1 Tax=Amazonocrinis nigriterrae CENA67 TaxID=2794033 RepID=A0A8J7HPT9_9NOST|nr:hypothetical protein [Amazonocrinis nigriterrae]MBH8561137.1 hypothetical protein [Amazonocrinis nigriterrae CENA67]